MFAFRIGRHARRISSVGIALILGVSAYGFAASNTVAETGAGDGANTISGYTITNVVYTQDTTGNITNVAFNVAPSAGAAQATTVKVKLVSSATNFQACTLSNAGTPVTSKDASCAITGVTARAADELRVIASQ